MQKEFQNDLKWIGLVVKHVFILKNELYCIVNINSFDYKVFVFDYIVFYIV